MATIDDLTPVLASAVGDTDVMYVGLPLNGDPDRQILVSEAKSLFLPDDGVTNTKLRNSAALSVIGRAGNTTGDPADIAAAVDGHVLRRSGTALGFGTVATAGIGDAQVTNVKIAAGVDAAKIGNGTVSNTEFQYLNGVTSAIQTQLNGKALATTSVTAGAGLTGGGTLAADRTISHAAHTGDVTGTTALTIPTGTVTPAKTTFMNSNSDSAGVFVGRVNTNGSAIRLPSGWSVVRNSSGSYTVTHNLGVTNYAVTFETVNTTFNVPTSRVSNHSSNFFTVNFYSLGASIEDTAFNFILVRY